MKPVSLYVHIPFCKLRCSYCTFYHVPHSREYEHPLVEALVAELECAARDISEPFVAPTVFVGGGTPSTLSSASLGRIFDTIAPYLCGTSEITLEVNPEDVTVELAAYLGRLGVNRISLGVQSMNECALRSLKRCKAAVNRRAMELVRNRFDNFSVDLLLGIPGSIPGDIEATVGMVLAYDPEHLSVYCLESGGDMEREASDFLAQVDTESSADEYFLVCRMLAEHGYHHYEVSNFARPGRESRHNHMYWNGGDYLGIGPGAHSQLDGRRFHNESSIESYLQNAGGLGMRRPDRRDDGQKELEEFMLALRTSRGLPLERLACPPEVPVELVDQGLAVRIGDRLVLTDRGYLVLNDILFRLIRAA